MSVRIHDKVSVSVTRKKPDWSADVAAVVQADEAMARSQAVWL